MSAVDVQEKLDKYLVRNNTAGYVGVITIDHKGEELGVNIEPYGARWMTHAEIVLTARAPRSPEDNPFGEQVLWGVNPETQAKQEVRVRPLTVEHDSERFVPDNDRYVPTVDAPKDTAPASVHEPSKAPSPAASPASSGSQAGQPTSPPTPPASPQGRPVPAPRSAPSAPRSEPQPGLSGSQTPAGGGEEGQSWVVPPEAPGEVLTGSLAGDDSVPDAASAPDPTNAPTSRAVPVAGQAQAAPQTPGQHAEEHAARVDPQIGEETGAARPPAQPQPEGEYAQAEEVGSPDAPALGDDDDGLIGG